MSCAPACPSCGHFRANHYVPGAKDQKTCAAAVQTAKGLMSCTCKIPQNEIPKEVESGD